MSEQNPYQQNNQGYNPYGSNNFGGNPYQQNQQNYNPYAQNSNPYEQPNYQEQYNPYSVNNTYNPYNQSYTPQQQDATEYYPDNINEQVEQVSQSGVEWNMDQQSYPTQNTNDYNYDYNSVPTQPTQEYTSYAEQINQIMPQPQIEESISNTKDKKNKQKKIKDKNAKKKNLLPLIIAIVLLVVFGVIAFIFLYLKPFDKTTPKAEETPIVEIVEPTPEPTPTPIPTPEPNPEPDIEKALTLAKEKDNEYSGSWMGNYGTGFFKLPKGWEVKESPVDQDYNDYYINGNQTIEIYNCSIMYKDDLKNTEEVDLLPIITEDFLDKWAYAEYAGTITSKTKNRISISSDYDYNGKAFKKVGYIFLNANYDIIYLSINAPADKFEEVEMNIIDTYNIITPADEVATMEAKIN